VLPSGVHPVGELTAGGAVVVLDAAGSAVEVEERGYDHFA
jgi:hypothetical protein